MASVFTQGKIKVLKWLTKSKSIWPLTSLTFSSTNFPLLFTHSTPAILASLLTLTQARNYPASEPEHFWILLNSSYWTLLPRHLHVTLSPPSGMCSINKFSRIFSWPCFFKLNPTSTLSILFLCSIFLHSTPCHQMTNYILICLLPVSPPLECMLHESRHFVQFLVPSIKNSA